MTRIEQIKLIAEFMDSDYEEIENVCRIDLYDKGHRNDEVLENPEKWCCYHNDFSCLMEVVEQIESMDYGVEIIGNYCKIVGTDIVTVGSNKLDAVYRSVIKFVKWYNENNK